MTNAIGLSVVDPQHLDVGIVNESWLHLFPPRHFHSALFLYKEMTESSNLLSCGRNWDSSDLPYLEYFGGVATDLSLLPLAISPLDRVQLLTSAFRKAMTGLSNLKLRPYRSDHMSKSTGKQTVCRHANSQLIGCECDTLILTPNSISHLNLIHCSHPFLSTVREIVQVVTHSIFLGSLHSRTSHSFGLNFSSCLTENDLKTLASS